MLSTQLPVLANTRGVRHGVRDVVLLVDTVEEMRLGSGGIDGHVLPSVGLMLEGDQRRELEIVVLCNTNE